MSMITHVGLDVHKRTIVAAALPPGQEYTQQWELPYDGRAAQRLVRKLQTLTDGEVVFCYEAGPTGFALQRQLEAAGFRCPVVAPSLIPTKPGDRIKTDHRDARKLALYLRSGHLTEVQPPSPEDEAFRDLWRCRDDAREDLNRARHRLGKFLLRNDVRWAGRGNNWTKRHFEWLRSLRLEDSNSQRVLEEYLAEVLHRKDRVVALDSALAEAAEKERYATAIAFLRCVRGIDTLAAVCLVSELYASSRFRSPRALMKFVGLVPSENSTGDDRRRGSITRTGNRHVRRMLIEIAHHAYHRPYVSKLLQRRREGQPPEVVAIADKAMQRLYRRHFRMIHVQKKNPKLVVTALARELVGFIWELLRLAELHRLEARA